MNAANPKTQEPSMEEILASIRRIIADDQDGGKAVSAPPLTAAAKPAPDDVLDLGEVATPVNPRAASLEMEHDDIGSREAAEMDFDALPADEAPPPPPQAVLSPSYEPEPVRERLLSSVTDSTVSSTFHMLSHTVLTQNARTLEDLVKDLLRPMLKSWLDENLPTMVERLVRAEIERVTRGR
jgi:cell pole-organizing protein PopZ